MKPEVLALLVVAVFAIGAIVIFVSLHRKGRRAAEERQRRIRHYEQPPAPPVVRHPQTKAAPAPSATSNTPASASTSSTTDDGILPIVLVHAVLASGDSHQQTMSTVLTPTCAATQEATASSPAADPGGACGSASE